MPLVTCLRVRQGATGHIGGHVAEQLAKAGVDTTALVRNMSAADQQRQTKLAALKALGVHLLDGSLDAEPSDLAQVLKIFTVVVSALRGIAQRLCPKSYQAAATQACSVEMP